MNRPRLTLRKSEDTNGHWFDISGGDITDSRFKPWRSISRRSFVLWLAAVAGLFAIGGWQLGILASSDVNPRGLVERLESSVYEIYCGEYAGTAFAVDLDVGDAYETILLTTAHVVEDCNVGETIYMEGREGTLSAILIDKTPSSLFDAMPSIEPDLAILGANFGSTTLKIAREINRGDWAVAMGYPWGQDQYLTFGVVSEQNATEVFVDVPLNEGNSGGPVVNRNGEVLGVVSYGRVMADLFEDNDEGTYDRADGISAIKKLRNLCSLPRKLITDCSMYP